MVNQEQYIPYWNKTTMLTFILEMQRNEMKCRDYHYGFNQWKLSFATVDQVIFVDAMIDEMRIQQVSLLYEHRMMFEEKLNAK